VDRPEQSSASRKSAKCFRAGPANRRQSPFLNFSAAVLRSTWRTPIKSDRLRRSGGTLAGSSRVLTAPTSPWRPGRSDVSTIASLARLRCLIGLSATSAKRVAVVCGRESVIRSPMTRLDLTRGVDSRSSLFGDGRPCIRRLHATGDGVLQPDRVPDHVLDAAVVVTFGPVDTRFIRRRQDSVGRKLAGPVRARSRYETSARSDEYRACARQVHRSHEQHIDVQLVALYHGAVARRADQDQLVR